jgi:nucleotide-binding universal stress UspA family protein
VNDEGHELAIRRILVALDASPHSLAALRAATRLAELFGAELMGVYVEDINLLRASELPFSREISIYSGEQRRFDLGQVERELRDQAEVARQALTESAERARVHWSFRVSRGTVVSELMTAASQMDLLIIGKSGWSPIERRRIGSTARKLLTRAPRAALVLEKGSTLRHPLAVVCDGSELGHKALRTAAALARREDSHLILLALSEDPEEARRIREQCSKWLRGQAVIARYRTFHEWTASRVAATIERESAGGLVVPATEAVFKDDQLVELLKETDTPVLLVR